MFTIGGLSGVTHAVAPADTQQTDTYYIVAHFHYVLFGGALLGFFGGFYFWWPKVFGYMLNERARQVALLDHARRLQPHVRPDAHPRPAGHEPSRTSPTATATASTSGTWWPPSVRSSSPSRLLIFFCNICAQLPRARKTNPCRRSGRRPVGRPQPRVDDPVARRPSTTSTRSPRSTSSTSSGTASTARTRTVAWCASPRPRTSCRRPARDRHPPAVAVVLAASCWPPACRSSATASSSTCWWAVLGALFVVAGIIGWVLEPSTDPEDRSGHGDHDDDHADRRRAEPADRSRRRRRRSLHDDAEADIRVSDDR